MLVNPSVTGQMAGGFELHRQNQRKKKWGGEGGDTDSSPQCKREFLEEG